MLQMFFNVAVVVVIFVGVNCDIEYPNVEYCPVVKNCRAPLVYNVRYRCASDKVCPQGYKCCRSDCYIHKVCVVAVNKNGEKIPLPTVTTDGSTELTVPSFKETEAIHTSTDANNNIHILSTEFTTNQPVDNATEAFNIIESSSIDKSIFIEPRYNAFSEKSESVFTTNASVTYIESTIHDEPTESTDWTTTRDSTVSDVITPITEDTSNVVTLTVDVNATTSRNTENSFTDDSATITILDLPTSTESADAFTEQVTKFTATEKEVDIEGSGSMCTGDDEDTVSSVHELITSSSLNIVNDDEDGIEGSGTDDEIDDRIVFPDDDRLTTFKPVSNEHKHITSSVSPTDNDFGFDTSFTSGTIVSTNDVHLLATENIQTTESSKNEVINNESLPTNLPERDLSTLTGHLITTETGDVVVLEGSGNDLTDDEPGDVDEENITDTSLIEDNFINITHTDTTPFTDITDKSIMNDSKTEIVGNTDEIDIDSPSNFTLAQSDTTERTTIVAIVEGSGSEFLDTEYGDDDEEITTYIPTPESLSEGSKNNSIKSSLNLTTPVPDVPVITVTEDEDEDDEYYDHDGVDEDIRNNFQGRITSG